MVGWFPFPRQHGKDNTLILLIIELEKLENSMDTVRSDQRLVKSACGVGEGWVGGWG